MELMLLGMLRPKKDASNDTHAQQALRSAEHLENELARMEERVDQLATVTVALWKLLKTKTDLTDEELTRAVQDIQQERQQEAVQTHVCPKCGRAMSARDRRCLYCDYRESEGDAFSRVLR